MSNDHAIYRGEAWCKRWGDSSAGGRTVTLQLDDEGEHPFRGYEGERFAVVIVPTGNDDTPMKKATPQAAGGHARAAALSPEQRSEIASKAAKRRWSDLRPSARAAMLCEDEDFGRYVFEAFPTLSWNVPNGTQPNSEHVLKLHLGITSKRELDQDATKAAKFDQLNGNFRAWQQAKQLGAA